MRKNFIKYGILASLALVSILASACSNKPSSVETTTVTETTAVESTESTETTKASDSFKSGLGVVTDISRSKNADDTQNGLAEADSTVAALILDKDDKIVNLKIDAAKTIVEFSKDGKLLTSLDSSFKTIKELGDEYGMKVASKIGKEWYEQVEAFENYAKGKSVEELTAIELTETGAAANVDLNSSVTMSVSSILSAVDKAAKNAKLSNAGENDEIGLAIATKIDSSKAFEDGNEGEAKIDSLYAMTSYSADGKITSAIIDGTNTSIGFNDIGEVTSDFEEEIKTKQELGADYGMKAASSISKEWNEQVDAISEFVIGKTSADLDAIEVADDGRAKDVDLVSKATMAISPFKDLLKKTLN